MITIFNRKLLITTGDTKIQAKIRDILALKEVDYIIKAYCSYQRYRIWVYKKDYEYACHLIKDLFRQQ
ncbi:MAG: hypothetical protein II997_07730 [Clostridia bacterium]|nr:hypothetical protein [Clostridia bacterium]